MKTAVALMILLTTFSVSAQDRAGTIVRPAPIMSRAEQAWHVGLLGGSTTAGDGTDVEFGVDVGMQPYIPFGAGFELAKTDTGSLSRTKALLRGTYNFGGELPVIRHSYFGLVAGMVFDRDTDFDGNWLASGPVIGFDIPIREVANQRQISLGAQAQSLITEGSAPDSFSLNGQAKFWF